MRKESIVPRRPDQILVLPLGSYQFSLPHRPLGWRLALAAQEGCFGGASPQVGWGQGLVTCWTDLGRAWQWWGGELVDIQFSWASTTPLTNAAVKAYVGRGLLSCIPFQCPSLCCDSSVCLRFDLKKKKKNQKSRECKRIILDFMGFGVGA